MIEFLISLIVFVTLALLYPVALLVKFLLKRGGYDV